ncbi:MAG: hypothetical protein JSV91_01790 [Phycisphaerales bacterium]|nr:MAG: hypothetical protein JSV91_01790 [Phycisphaerales bacterium]
MRHLSFTNVLITASATVALVSAAASGGADMAGQSPYPLVLGWWGDNFDTYNTVQRLPDQSTWEAWNNDVNAANFYATTAQSFSPPNSVEIDGPDDAVHRYSGYTLGKWLYNAWVFVPQAWNEVQYFILLNTYPANLSQDWSLQLEIDGANGVINDYLGTASLPLQTGLWSNIQVYIDLDRDLQTVFYNGTYLVSKSWSAGVAAGGARNIAAVDLWGNNTGSPLYYDDMWLGGAPLGMHSYSIDFQSPSKGTLDSCFGIPITEGDILLPGPPFFPIPGPNPPPCIAAWGGPGPNPGPDLGMPTWNGAVGLPQGVPGLVELDAMSYGADFNWDPVYPWPGLWYFSVDEFAWGFPGMPGPSVTTEGMAGANEASADSFIDLVIGPGPFPPGPPIPDLSIFDGNGFAPTGAPGIGLIEPNPPNVGPMDWGDTMDAMDIDEPVGPQYVPFPVYFSLDSGFMDPLEGPPVNSGSALGLGFVGGDVLVTTTPGALPVVYATAAQLGLDQIAGPDTDDLDALILRENGVPGYQPSQQPFDWIGGATDMLFFSVRRGSAVWGAPDSLWGFPIEEGDILCPPVLGGVSPFPGIYIPAEMIGLGTIRSGTGNPWTGFSDDLDALDLAPDCNGNMLPDTYDIWAGMAQDCNSNWIPDMCDLMLGTSVDCNNNGIPDECENPPPCPEDVNRDCVVDINDIFAVLAAWGSCGGCPEDVNFDGVVDINDLFQILGNWGAC